MKLRVLMRSRENFESKAASSEDEISQAWNKGDLPVNMVRYLRST